MTEVFWWEKQREQPKKVGDVVRCWYHPEGSMKMLLMEGVIIDIESNVCTVRSSDDSSTRAFDTYMFEIEMLLQ